MLPPLRIGPPWSHGTLIAQLGKDYPTIMGKDRTNSTLVIYRAERVGTGHLSEVRSLAAAGSC